MKIAVIGAGIFGSTVAIRLARDGFETDLFEKESDILQAASGINQYRLHRGYHYPRSKETALSSKFSESSFREEYGEAVMDHNEHYYVLAKYGSKVSTEQFLNFCQECGLEHEQTELEHIGSDKSALIIRGKEAVIDPLKLKGIVLKKITENNVKLILNRVFIKNDISKYDQIINCTYANLNSIFEDLPGMARNYQFEVCEKPILKLPSQFKQKSIVILDGPFFCIDPYSDTDYHVMGNVVHAIHASNIGKFPKIPLNILPLLNKGIIKNPSVTNIDKFISSAVEFMPALKNAEHIGSMYTVRTVLPDVEHTDERPTLVSRVNEKIINVFSGKIGNCVEAANQVLNLINSELSQPLYILQEQSPH